ncbi:MAG: hypothetical protein KC502_04670 [Myxococcales bacterium]|nr:hypothetical protein [Myxococcales bacterium]
MSIRMLPFIVSLTALLALGACGNDNSSGTGGTAAKSCEINSDCDAEEQCINKKCAAKFAGGDVLGTFDAGNTDDAASTTDAKATTDTGSTGTKSGGDCATCQADADCADGYGCVPMLNSTTHNFCVKKCSANNECTPGLLCQNATQATQKFCIPPTFKCEGCAVDGCKGEESCDFAANPPKCVKVGGACSACQLSKDCGAGMVCVKQGNDKVCAPSCAGDEKCPGASACVAFGGGIKACSFASDKCCYDASCSSSSACQGCPGKCVAGQCVECLKDADCKEGSCITSSFTCQKAKCPDDKPQKLVTGECVECTNDTHCAASSVGPKCIGNACSKANQSNECSVCQAPYPGCVEINGTWSCVECATDDDCKKTGKGTCSAKTYTCSATTGGTVTPSTKCTKDSDCKPGTTGFKLKCDVPTGTCYDVNGQCDNLTAFCNASKGSQCKPFDMLGLGGAGGGLPQIPGLPGGGGTSPTTSGAGVCSCGSASSGGGSWDDSICKLLSLKSCDCAKDSKSKDCDPAGLGSCCQASGGGGGGNPLSLLTCLSQLSGGKPDPACYGGKSCSDLSCLTAAMGGGGTSSGKGGYCADPGATP